MMTAESGASDTPAALANRTVAVVSGTVSEMWVRDNLVATNRTPSRDVLIFAGEGSAVTALRSGTVELGIFDSLAGFGNLANLSLRLAGTIATGILYSLAFPRTAEGLVLRDRVNTELQALILFKDKELSTYLKLRPFLSIPAAVSENLPHESPRHSKWGLG